MFIGIFEIAQFTLTKRNNDDMIHTHTPTEMKKNRNGKRMT